MQTNKQAFTRNCHAEFLSASTPLIETEQKEKSLKVCGHTPAVQDENGSGFTLIELLVVVLIIGILAAVAVPQYQVAVDKSKYRTIIAVMRSIVKAENLYKLEYGDYTLNWVELASTGIDIAHTGISEDKRIIYLNESEHYDLEDGGTYPHVTFGNKTVGIYAALPVGLWICYPYGTTRGKAICKHLGCAANELDKQYCYFKPN